MCHDVDNKNFFSNLRNFQQCHTSHPVHADTLLLKVALKSQKRDLWEAVIHEQLESLRETQTWDEVQAPKCARVIPSKFVPKVKRHSDEAVERHKARQALLRELPASSSHLLLRHIRASIQLCRRAIMFFIACDRKWRIRQLDVKSPFSTATLTRITCVCLTATVPQVDLFVLELKRGIYGLRQAPRTWNKRLTQELRFTGYSPLINVESVFCSILQSCISSSTTKTF
jgi:Reverse transcriptase (RNA-dependent DNA polymerase)